MKIRLIVILLLCQSCGSIQTMRYSRGLNISLNLSGKTPDAGEQRTKTKKRSGKSEPPLSDSIIPNASDPANKIQNQADLQYACAHTGILTISPDSRKRTISPEKQSFLIPASFKQAEDLIQNQSGAKPYKRVSNYTKASIVLSLLTGAAFYFAFISELYFFWFPVGIIALACLYLAIRGIRQIRRHEAGGWSLAVLSVLLALANYAMAGVLLLGAIFEWLFP